MNVRMKNRKERATLIQKGLFKAKRKGKGKVKADVKGKGKGKCEFGSKGVKEYMRVPQFGGCWTCGGDHFSRDCPIRKGG